MKVAGGHNNLMAVLGELAEAALQSDYDNLGNQSQIWTYSEEYWDSHYMPIDPNASTPSLKRRHSI
jgi:hypothetical protein